MGGPMIHLARYPAILAVALVVSCAISEEPAESNAPLDAAPAVAKSDGYAAPQADAAPASEPVATTAIDAAPTEIEAAAEAPTDAIAVLPVPSIDGVVLWLDGSRGVTEDNGRISRWADQSAQHNDAAPPSAGVAPSLGPNLVNGHPAVHFEAARKTVLLVTDAASLHFGTGDLTIEAVVGYRNKSKGGTPVDHLDGWGYVFDKMVGNRLGVGLMGNWPVSETDPIGSQFGCETTEQGGSLLSKAKGYNDGVARLWAMRRAGTTVELRRAGAVDNSGKWNPPVNVDAMGTPPVSIGARLYQGQTSASFPLDGDVAEIVVVKGTIAEAQLASLESYLSTKYALH